MSPTAACEPVTATSKNGDQLRADRHGGHLLSWQVNDVEQLWLSPQFECGPGKAIRGGVPVIFPQFAGRGPLPKHGLARDRAWTSLEIEPDAAALTAELSSDEATLAIWPHPFTLTLTAHANRGELHLALAVRNDAPRGAGAPLAFTAALHTYLTAAPGSLLRGLDGARGEDNAAGGAATELAADTPDGDLDALAVRDVAVRDLDGAVDLVRPDGSRLSVVRDGFPDLVLWHPGADHGLSDVPAGRPHFVCLEPAALNPIELAPGATWHGTATYSVRG